MSRWRGSDWLVWLWAVGGVLAVLAHAVVRLGPRALAIFEEGLTPGQALVAAAWTAFMLYSEGWRGFHLQFSPRVIVRAHGIVDDPQPWLVALAPVVAMGLVHGTPRRLLVSRLLVAAIVVMVLLVSQLPDPWRGIVDLGVVLGLVFGAGSILWYAARALLGRPPRVDAEFPEAA